MCGINGILYFDNKQVNREELIIMRDILEHRGPDDSGVFVEENIGLGHRRLSILDTSSAGHQPFLSENKRYVIVLNGEIYNYKSFYNEIKSKGYQLKTGTDTEVLLILFELYGLEILPRLKGMFSFAIWDKSEKKLFLVRDRMGVKPLYYAFHKNGIYFTSETKALFKVGVEIELSENGLDEYFFNRFVSGENTLFRNVKKLLPGHYMVLDSKGSVQYRKWWDLKHEIQNQSKIINPKKWFEEVFFESVNLRMVSDVPVGVLLSGGLDSSSILSSLYHQNYKDINTFSVEFNETEHNEAFLAKKISEEYNYNFHSINLNDELLLENLIQSTYYNDKPLMHFNEPHLLGVSKLAKDKVKVLLSGEGADELMGGYVRYKALKNPSLLKVVSVLSGIENLNKKPRLNKLFRYSKIETSDDLVIYNGSNIFPEDIEKFYGIKQHPFNSYRYSVMNDAKELYPNNPQRQALYFDQHTYLCSLLDRNDRCTMGTSIECREPFLDERLIAGLGTLDDKWFFTGKKGKFILKSAMENKLPSEILNFRKIGLSAPWKDYLLNYPSIKNELEDMINSPIFEIKYLDNVNPKKLIQELQNGNDKLVPFIMPIFMFHIWHKYYFQKLSKL